MPFHLEAEIENFGPDSSISGAEFAKVVKKLIGGRAPGVDEICLEFLKVMDVVGLCCLMCIGGRFLGLADQGAGPPI